MEKKAYTAEQVRYIKEVLYKNNQTIIFLLHQLEINNIDASHCESSQEIETAIRILEMESQNVGE